MAFTAVGHRALCIVVVVAIGLATLVANGAVPVCAQEYAAIIA